MISCPRCPIIFTCVGVMLIQVRFDGVFNLQKTAKNLVLAIESSGRMGSVAIAAGPDLLAEKSITGPMRHSSELFPAIQQLLAGVSAAPDDIKDVYISVGPGSFTGLRIAVTIAKMMNLTLGVRIVTVDTLDVIAENIDSATADRMAVVLDAKRSQFFTAAYISQQGRWHKTLENSLLTSPQLMDILGTEPVLLAGEGLMYHKDKFKSPCVSIAEESLWYPHAASVHKLGYEKALANQFTNVITLQPAYLRRPEPEEKWEQKQFGKQ